MAYSEPESTQDFYPPLLLLQDLLLLLPTPSTSTSSRFTAVSTHLPYCPGGLWFGNQQTCDFCSGTLIVPNKIATAGHCISSCGSVRVVFGADNESIVAGNAIPADTIYSCTPRPSFYDHTAYSGSESSQDFYPPPYYYYTDF